MKSNNQRKRHFAEIIDRTDKKIMTLSVWKTYK